MSARAAPIEDEWGAAWALGSDHVARGTRALDRALATNDDVVLDELLALIAIGGSTMPLAARAQVTLALVERAFGRAPFTRRARLADTIAQVGPRALVDRAVAPFLSARTRDDRRVAARATAQPGARHRVRALAPALVDEEGLLPEVAFALAVVGGDASARVLSRAIGRARVVERRVLVRSLARIDDAGAVADRALARALAAEDDDEVRVSAAHGLSTPARGGRFAALLAADRDPRVRLLSVRAATRAPVEARHDLLTRLRRDDDPRVASFASQVPVPQGASS